MTNSLLLIAKELRQETQFISSPVLKKRLVAWAQRLEDIAQREKQWPPKGEGEYINHPWRNQGLVPDHNKMTRPR